MSEIYYTSEYTDENGEKWYCINGEVHYSLEKWTKEEAEADYTSEEETIKRQISYMESYGFYD